MADTPGRLLHAVVHPADIQDRDGGMLVPHVRFGMYPFLLKLFLDGGCRGPQFHGAAAAILLQFSIEVVRGLDRAKASRRCRNTASPNSLSPGWADAAGGQRTSRS